MKYSTLYLFNSVVCIAQPSRTFDSDLDSWTAACNGGCIAPTLTRNNSVGNPDGCATETDVRAGFWYFLGPAEFNGDLTAYYGCKLKFDLKQNSTLFQTNKEDIIIEKSDGSKIIYDTPGFPGAIWKYTSFSGASVSAVGFTLIGK